jgi:hypothetical protein
MLVVRPNPRRMRAFRDSPAEGSAGFSARAGMMQHLRWERVLLAVGAIGVIALAAVALVSH